MTRRTIIMIVAALLLVVVAAGAATASGVAWSNERLTTEVKVLKRQTAALRFAVRDINANYQNYDNHVDQLIVGIYYCAEKPEGEEAACMAPYMRPFVLPQQ